MWLQILILRIIISLFYIFNKIPKKIKIKKSVISINLLQLKSKMSPHLGVILKIQRVPLQLSFPKQTQVDALKVPLN